LRYNSVVQHKRSPCPWQTLCPFSLLPPASPQLGTNGEFGEDNKIIIIRQTTNNQRQQTQEEEAKRRRSSQRTETRTRGHRPQATADTGRTQKIYPRTKKKKTKIQQHTTTGSSFFFDATD
jgi:hypothetical protein